MIDPRTSERQYRYDDLRTEQTAQDAADSKFLLAFLEALKEKFRKDSTEQESK